MGLFKKNKKDNKAPAPPGSPNSQESGNKDTPMPPPPGASSSSQAPPAPGSQGAPTPGSMGAQDSGSPSTGNLQAGMPEPPTPSSEGINDIKNQISSTQGSQGAQASGSMEAQGSSLQGSQPPGPTGTSESGNTESMASSNEDEIDSLFDFSDLDSQLPGDNDSSQEQNTTLPATQEEKTKNHSEEDLRFVKTQDSHKNSTNESLYITTAQFKSLLEIVEEVKNKAKDSADRHLRLLDIKSEEDIEYENLKKDFAFIEDKLYEVDNLIFEK